MKIFGMIIFIVLVSYQALAQVDSAGYLSTAKGIGNTPYSLFGSDSLLEITLRFDLTDYLRKNSGGTSQLGNMTINPGSSDSISLAIRIDTRGTFRLEHCPMAPMEITFRKHVLAYQQPLNINDVKLVSVCNFSPPDEEYILREFLVYKMFNAITDTSFRVRLLKVNYVDTKKNRKPVRFYGFFIEPKSVLAARQNAVVIRNMNLTQRYIDQQTMDRVSIFNYMAGNWDWAVQSLHNIVILKSLKYNSTDLGLAVPFDFDLTGVVDPYYNKPPSTTGLKSNRDRIFMGMCRRPDEFYSELLWFKAKKGKIYKVVSEFQYLNPRAKKDIISYLDTFFDQLDDERRINNLIRTFMSTCLEYQ